MVWAGAGRTGGGAPAEGGEGEGGCRRGMGARHADNARRRMASSSSFTGNTGVRSTAAALRWVVGAAAVCSAWQRANKRADTVACPGVGTVAVEGAAAGLFVFRKVGVGRGVVRFCAGLVFHHGTNTGFRFFCLKGGIATVQSFDDSQST